MGGVDGVRSALRTRVRPWPGRSGSLDVRDCFAWVGGGGEVNIS